MLDFPSPATTGQLFASGGVVWRFDGTKWIASAQIQGAVIVSDTAPSNVPAGTLWWDSLGGNLYIWFQDPNSAEWVICNSGGIGEAPNDGNTYARQNQIWANVSAPVAAAPNNFGRNLVHNGMFNIQQRGASGFPTTGYAFTADRWQFDAGAGDTLTTTIVTLADADRAQIGDEAARWALQCAFVGTSATNAYTDYEQAIEDVHVLGGKTFTVSFWAIRTAGTATRIGVNLYQWFGTGGSPSTAVWLTPQTVTLNTTWTRYSVTFSMPSTSGKTLGTNGDDASYLGFGLSSGPTQNPPYGIGVQSGTVRFWGVQVEIGSVATSLAKRHYAEELALCQRYLQTWQIWYAGTATASGSSIGTTVYLPVTMRGTGINVAITANSSAGVIGAVSTGGLNQNAFYVVTTSNGTGGYIINCYGTAANEI